MKVTKADLSARLVAAEAYADAPLVVLRGGEKSADLLRGQLGFVRADQYAVRPYPGEVGMLGGVRYLRGHLREVNYP